MSWIKNTYLYCRPGVLSTPEGELEVDTLLLQLAGELGFSDEPMFRDEHGTSIVVPGIEPEEVWTAMGRIATHRTLQQFFVLPGP